MARFTPWIMSDIDALREIEQAAIVMDDWLGDGANPVPKTVSTSRAIVCAGCANNVTNGMWADIKQLAALGILKAIEVKNSIRANTPHDDDLHGCKVCGCALKLKVHVPLQHILSTLTEKQEKEFRKVSCWITTEKDQQ